MQVTETLSEGLKRAYKVDVSAAEIETKSSERLKEVGAGVSLPGFRKGKVPMPLLKKRYGPSVLGEVLQAVVEEGTQTAIEEHSLKPAMQPSVDLSDFKEGEDLSYSMELEVLPEIEAMDFREIEIERLKVDVKDEEIDEALTMMAERAKTSEPVKKNRKSKKGDIVVIDFNGSIDGKELPGMKAEDFHLELGSDMFIPGFEDQVIGLKGGDDTTVNVTFPDNYGGEEMAGKDAVFEVTVKEVREPKLPEMDDEFAKGMGQESLADLKELVRVDLGSRYEDVQRTVLKRRMLDILDEKHNFDLPQGMVDQEFEAIWKQIEADKEAGNLDDDDKKKSDDDLKKDYRQIAERRVKLGLLLSHVGTENDIEITEADLNTALMREARRYPGQEREVIEFFRNNQEAVMGLRAPVLEEKVIDFISEVAKVNDKSVTAEELQKAVDDLDAD